jgi:DNA-binding NtrC family response regulator
MTRRILLVDNDVEMVRMLARHFESEGWSTIAVASGADAMAAVQREDVDVVLCDLVMDGVDGLAVLRAAQQREPSPRVILMTAFGSLESAIEAIRHGAYDYLTKPFRLDAATLAVNRALDDHRLREENRRLKAEIEERFGLDTLLGRSPAMQALFEKIRAVAKTDATVLLIGESGTGKELVARAIHHASARGTGPLVAVNCAAIPEGLLESELFGHERGAFTGAVRTGAGRFELARGATLFLAEIGDMPLAM